MARRRRHLLVVLSGLALTGCMTDQSGQPSADVPEVSTLSRSDAAHGIVSLRSQLWKDPQSIREAKLSDPIICPAKDLSSLQAQPGSTCACVEVNAKNGFGGYTGLHRTVIIFPPSGAPSTSDAGIKGFATICDANMAPFPEMNGDYVAPGRAKGKRAAG